jgi:YidC/Oxa1 family membrane protein insertase
MNIILNILNQVINSLYSVVGDWGIAIILTTIIIRSILLPLSWKQKKSIGAQQEISKKIEEIKMQYENDKEKQHSEIAKISAESAKSLFGCLITFLQIPIMYSLYRVFSEMPINIGSIIVPWIANLKLPDSYYIIPVIAVLVQLLPNIIMTYKPIKAAKNSGLPITQMLIMGLVSLLFFVKAPVTLGIYWITSGLYSALEQIIYFKNIKRHKLTI